MSKDFKIFHGRGLTSNRLNLSTSLPTLRVISDALSLAVGGPWICPQNQLGIVWKIRYESQGLSVRVSQSQSESVRVSESELTFRQNCTSIVLVSAFLLGGKDWNHLWCFNVSGCVISDIGTQGTWVVSPTNRNSWAAVCFFVHALQLFHPPFCIPIFQNIQTLYSWTKKAVREL